MKRRVASLAATLSVLSGCVSLDEPAVQKGVIRPGQRAVFFLYESPGPWITMAVDTKAESAAMYLPGLGFALQSVQNDRDLKVSQSLAQYLPLWSLERAFRPYLQAELAKTGIPVRWVEAGPAAEITADDLRRLNRAKDPLEWRVRYLAVDPEEKAPRNYANFLQLDDAVIVEFNLQHGLLADARNEMYPTAGVLVRLYRAGTMRQLWSHEESVDLPGEPRNLYDYQSQPRLYLYGIEKLMPTLAQKTGAAMAAAFGDPAWKPPEAPAPGVMGDTTKVVAPVVSPTHASTAAAAVPPASVAVSSEAGAVPAAAVTASTESAAAPPPGIAASTETAPSPPSGEVRSSSETAPAPPPAEEPRPSTATAPAEPVPPAERHQ